jgi:glutathione peroxidase
MMRKVACCLLSAMIGLQLTTLAGFAEKSQGSKEVSPVLNFKVKNIHGAEIFLGDYQGTVLLIVNVASQCGLTPQYEELEKLYQKYKDQGFQILAFPANNFKEQEPGTDEEILNFCKTKYDVTFDLFSKVSVKGEDKCGLYKFLTDDTKNTGFGGEIAWNFQKYLVDRQGKVAAKFEPTVKPLDEKITSAIEKALMGTGKN